jgi:hypothetical protein
MTLRTIFVVLAILTVASAQTELGPKDDLLLERARKGDESALSQMEQSGDIRDLQSLLHDPNYAGKTSVRLALARMGDRGVLQRYACVGLTQDLSHLDDLMRDDLDHIGGDFTIEVYRHLLDSDARFLPQIDRIMKQMRKHGGDVLPVLPSTSVLLRLPKLVPDSPIPRLSPIEIQASPEKSDGIKAQWRTWIDTHQNELKKLRPTTDGISFDLGRCSQLGDGPHH